MLRSSFLAATALAVTSAFAMPQPACAQDALPMSPQPTPDADALAASMRRLASNPRDLDALITAGELSLKVGDASGAAALFRRAEQVDPMNGRVKAGMARILVTQERPGEALRYFDQAVGYGLDPRSFAGDRGLAYDLIGQQERAQRDYRLALKAGDNDEVRRRYALSLGIAGKRDAALVEIDTLLRRNDRGAWRARAFILAMTGDGPGATKIAQTMMPGAMAQGLASFFVVLPTLSPTDRAFAVHFGEVRATPERLVDARLIPALPTLGPDPDARVQVAVAAPVPVAQPRNRRDRRRRDTPARVEIASAAPVAAIRGAVPAPGFGSVGNAPLDPARASASAIPARQPTVAAAPAAVGPAAAGRAAVAPVRVASVPQAAIPQAIGATPPRPAFARQAVEPLPRSTAADYLGADRYSREGEERLARARALAPPTIAPAVTSPPASSLAAARLPTVATVAVANPPVPAPTPSTSAALIQPGSARIVSATPATAVPASAPPPQTAQATSPAQQPPSVPSPAQSAAASPVAATPSQPDAVAVTTPPSASTAPGASEDSILARIVAGLSIPGYELGVGAPPPVPLPAAAPVEVAAASTPGPVPLSTARAMSAAAPPAPVQPPAVVATRTTGGRRAVPETAPRQEERASALPPRRNRATAPVEVAGAEPRRGGTLTAGPDAADDTPDPRTRAGRRAAAERKALAAKAEVEDAPDLRTRAGRRAAAERRALAAKVDTDDAPDLRTRAGRRAAADRKALAAKADADAASIRRGAKGKPASRKESDGARATKAEPSRIWVQVAGGANESDLPKAWSSVQSRTPALKGRPAYSTPLRATNRVVTGPFKTDAEARAFVNQLARQGVSAFPFTSNAGQAVKKLPPK